MSQVSVEQFFGRLLTDEAFLQEILSRRNKALMEKGFRFTELEWRAIEATDITKFSSLSSFINKRLQRENNGNNTI